jgi:hypothetical protein
MRDWAVDTGLFVLAALFMLVLVSARVESNTVPGREQLFALDQVVGVLGCCALWLRRRWPVGLPVVLLTVSSVSELVGGAALVALFTVAVRRPPQVTAVLFVLGVVATAVFAWVRPEAGKTVVALGFGFAVQCAVVGWGTVVRHRRELVLSLRELAAHAEAEAALRAERAQLQAREPSPARCTTCSATGCRCSACMRARWSTARTRQPRTSRGRRPSSARASTRRCRTCVG